MDPPEQRDDELVVPQGYFHIARYPDHAKDALRAWDAADELLQRYLAADLAADLTGDLTGAVVIVNDGHGALATALAEHHPHVLSDSFLSHVATRRNLERNGIDATTVTMIASFDPLPTHIAVLVMKVPKSHGLLEDQLHRLAPHLQDGSLIVAAAMTKHMHTSTLDLFERIIGPTHTSLAQKKARLIHCTVDPQLSRPQNPWPATWTYDPGLRPITSHAGVFSADRLDIGTRFFLDHLPLHNGPEQVIDLGCGNGVVGTMYAAANPDAEVTFIDESFRAVASAETTFRAHHGAERLARFATGNNIFDLADDPPLPKGSVDLVLTNPPFHTDHAVSDATAWRMFCDSRDALCAGGELWVVGNRHLAYHAKLKRLFGNCEVVASNAKFVVVRATRR